MKTKEKTNKQQKQSCYLLLICPTGGLSVSYTYYIAFPELLLGNDFKATLSAKQALLPTCGQRSSEPPEQLEKRKFATRWRRNCYRRN